MSWAYVFEWPIFGGYAVFMWWKLIHETAPGAASDTGDPSSGALTGTEMPVGDPDVDRHPPGGTETEDDEELASYNRYLAALHASGKRKQW